MPSKNVVKEFASGNYYHIYNRGVAKQVIFFDVQDREKFLNIVKRHLDPKEKSVKSDGVPYRKFNENIELLCYCLMGNHFHMLFYLKYDDKSLSEFMQSLLTAYVMYFNKKYKRVGTLFQSVFKGSRISNESYLLHITRYIHLNPSTYKFHKYSSIKYYLYGKTTRWLKPGRILKIFEGENYSQFLKDYEGQRAILEELKYELADR